MNKSIDYFLVTMESKDRGIFSMKVFDALTKTEARKEAHAMEKGKILTIIIVYKQPD